MSLAVTPVSSSTIGIEFVGNGTAMGPTESAGVVARPNWNNATGATRSTPLALKDDAGAATGATVVWTSDNVWSTPIADQAGNARLMKGYLDTGLGNASTVTVAGLPAAAYDVYASANSSGGYVFSGLANGSYAVMPGKSGFAFTPSSRNATINGADVTGVDFTASAQSPISVSITSPSGGATVPNAFSIAANASAGVVAVQFRVDGQNAGAEDTSAPYSTSVTAPAGSHALTAVARDASGTTVTSAAVNVTVSAGSGTALAVNGAQTFQTIDGFGVNLNSLSWKNGELRPAIDKIGRAHV